MRVEPGDHVMQARQSPARRSGAGEIVILVRNAHHRDIALEHLEEHVHLLRLLDRAAQVLLVVNDQQRRCHGIDIADRRVLQQLFGIRPRGSAGLVNAEVEPDIAGADERIEVRHAPLRDGGFEPIGVTDDPVREVAAVAAAGHTHPRFVDEP